MFRKRIDKHGRFLNIILIQISAKAFLKSKLNHLFGMKNILIILISLYLFSLSISSCNNQNNSRNKDLKTNPIDSLTRLIKRHKKDALLYAERARVNANSGNTEAAIKDLSVANRLDSLNPQFYIDLADFYIQMGNSGKTRDILERANRNIKQNPAILYRLGNLYFYIQDYTQALKYLNQSIKTDPYYPMAYFSRAMLLLEQKDTANAITNFQIAIEREPEYYEAYLQLGLVYLSKSDSISLMYYNNALKLHPNSYEANYGKAMFYQKSKQPQKAIQTYKTMIRGNIGQAEQLYFNIAYNYMNHLDLYEKAIIHYDSAIYIQEYFTEAYCNRAYCFEQLNQTQNALNDYKKALEISPDYQIAKTGTKRINTH